MSKVTNKAEVIHLYKSSARVHASGLLRSETSMVAFELEEQAFEATWCERFRDHALGQERSLVCGNSLKRACDICLT